MTKHNKEKILGGVVVAFLFGIPLALVFGPIAVIIFLSTLLVGLLKKERGSTKISETRAIR